MLNTGDGIAKYRCGAHFYLRHVQPYARETKLDAVLNPRQTFTVIHDQLPMIRTAGYTAAFYHPIQDDVTCVGLVVIFDVASLHCRALVGIRASAGWVGSPILGAP